MRDIVSVGWLKGYCSMLVRPRCGEAPSEAYVEVSHPSGAGREVDFAAYVDFRQGEMTVLRGGLDFYEANSRGMKFGFVASEIYALYRDGYAFRVKSRRFGPGRMDAWKSLEESKLEHFAATGEDPTVAYAV